MRSLNGLDTVRGSMPGTLLANLNGKERAELLALAERRSFGKDEYIFQAGSVARNVYLLIDGRVKIFELSSLGREVILWFCFNGEMFRLAETPRESLRQVYAQACSPVSLLAISRVDFCAFLRDNPEVALQVIDLVSSRMRGLGDMLLNFSSEDVATRLIKLLTRLGMIYGTRTDDEIRVNIPLTHQELADMIGATRQTVTTNLGILRREGWIRTEKRCIVMVEGFAMEPTGPGRQAAGL